MAVSIFECLQNAEYNLVKNRMNDFAFQIGKEQLRNAVALLEKGYSIHDEVEPLLEEHGSIDNVPEKQPTP